MNCSDVYSPEELPEVMRRVRKHFRFSYNKGIKYFNVPCSFDIETSSFYNDEGEKSACMYIWQFGIYGLVIIGRTWGEFVSMLDSLSGILDLNEKKRLLIYVHNLGYEFQFMRKYFVWKKVFSVSSREPVYCLDVRGLEFRCSYILSGYSLANLGDELQSYKVQKMVGDLDYELMRNNKTELTKKELDYCINDVKVVMAFIAETIERDGGISKIPLTKTGYARQYVRNSCWYTPGVSHKEDYKRFKYCEFMRGLTLDPDEYNQLKRAFQGGFTHANPFYSGKTVNDVTSFDFTSSYPSVMLSEKFPMSKGELIEIGSLEEFEKNLNMYWCLFDIEFIGLEPRLLFDNYISRSRCAVVEKATIDNGRIVRADRLITTITGEDYRIIEKFYSWSKMRISCFRRYRLEYLPTDFVKAILKLYKDKTELKGISGKEIEYQVSKGLLNACFGMTCTDIVRDENIYNGDTWEVETPDLEKAINKYNKSWSRFLFYPWGVAICAYARKNLFTGILEFGNDYIYSDTDSIKVINADKHREYIDSYNNNVISKLKKAMEYHGIDPEEIEPRTIKGVKKPLGIWDFDGHYKRFKTLGAKRYMVEYDNGEINITVSGLNKKTAVPFITDKAKKENVSPFDVFTSSLYVPPDFTGKKTHTYIDEPRTGILTDYRGVSARYNELSCIHLSKQDYELSISREYSDYLSSLTYL